MTPEELVPILRRPLAELPGELALCPVPGPFEVTVRPPGSKSLTNRALLLAALAAGESRLTGCLLDADDAKVMIAALRVLGAAIDINDRGDSGCEVRVRGVGGRFRGGGELRLNNAGTATRFLAATASLADAPVVIDGNARMRQRPIAELLGMMRALGVRIDEMGEPGCVPIRVHPCRTDGGVLEVGVTRSSQFVSAVMLVAPWMADGLEVRFTAPPTSPSYIDMTLGLLRRVGVEGATREADWSRAKVNTCAGLKGFEIQIEPDASGATYFWGAAAAVPGSHVVVSGLPSGSMQGDSGFRPRVLERMGAPTGGLGRGLRGIDVDLSLMPDTAMTAAAVACFAEGTTTLRGLRTLRVKETDRLAALRNELTKIGAGVEVEGYVGAGGVRDELLRVTAPGGGIDCSPTAASVAFDTYDDHRMAMSLAIIGLRRPNVVIRDPACVAKTYPSFWKDWAGMYQEALGTGLSALESGRH